MRLNAPMLKRRLRRLLVRQPPDIRDLATRTWMVARESGRTIPPALYLSGDEEMISGLSPWRSWDTEREMIRGGVVRDDASFAHLLEHVDVAGPLLYKGAAKDQRGHGDERLLLDKATPVTLREAAIVSSRFGSDFFGTHLQYDFPLALLADGGPPAIMLATRPFPHGADYRRLCGLPPTTLVSYGHIAKLTLFTDYAENDSKGARYRELRRRLRRSLTGGPVVAPAGIYIRRGTSGELRLLLNETEIEKGLAAQGFTVIDPETASAYDIARASLDAPLVISVEGSQLSHAIFSVAEDATFLVLQPPDRFSLSYKEFTDRVGMRFAFVVGERSGAGFTVAFEKIQRLLGRLR